MDIPVFMLPHSCTVEPYLGTTGEGIEQFGPAVTIEHCMVDTGTKLLSRANQQQGTGDEVTSPAAVYTQLSVDTSSFVPSSILRYDIGAGPRRMRISTIERLDGGTLPVPSHVLIKGE